MSESFMSEMQTTVIGQVESLTRYEMEGNKGGSIWVSKPNSGKNENVLGRELMKIKMPFAMFDQLKAKQDSGELSFPAEMEILCDIDMGGGNKAVLSAVSIRKVLDEKTTSAVPPSTVSTAPLSTTKK
ncbi:MAG: hypothetical protein GQ532_18445 [Methylomarinum sp.]|nr:hypothetical protein [Methylomarinum sp.]